MATSRLTSFKSKRAARKWPVIADPAPTSEHSCAAGLLTLHSSCMLKRNGKVVARDE